MFAVRTSILRQVVARCQRYRHASAMSFLSLWVHRTDSFRVWLCLLHYALWQYRLWSFQGRDTKLERVLAKINIHKVNHWILKIGLVASCQILGIILENKVIWKLMLSKKVNNKNVLLNSYSSVKKNLKDSDDFWHRKFTLKVKFWHFGTPHYTNLQNSIISFEYVCWLLAKNLSNFVSLPWKLNNRYCHTMHNGFRYFVWYFHKIFLNYNSFYRYIHKDLMKLQSNIDTNAFLEIISTHCLMFL